MSYDGDGGFFLGCLLVLEGGMNVYGLCSGSYQILPMILFSCINETNFLLSELKVSKLFSGYNLQLERVQMSGIKSCVTRSSAYV